MTRPCECGLNLRPRRLFGFLMEPMDGAPCFFSGSLTLGVCGLPSTDSLADRFVAGNGKIQGGLESSVMVPGFPDGAVARHGYLHRVGPSADHDYTLLICEGNGTRRIGVTYRLGRRSS